MAVHGEHRELVIIAANSQAASGGGSLTTRLIVILTLCAAVIIGLGVLVDYRLSRDDILERLQQESRETVRAVVIDIENWLDGVESSTLLLARVLEQRHYSEEGLVQMLRDAIEVNADIYGATIAVVPSQPGVERGFAPYFFRDDGALDYADLADPRYNYQRQAWFLDAVSAGEPLWVEPYFDDGGGRVLMTTYAVPVFRRDAGGERFLYAVVTADVPLAELHDYLQRLRLGDSGFGILLSRSGTVLSDRNSANIMRNFQDTLIQEQDQQSWQEMFEAALQGQVVARQLTCTGVPGRCVIRLGALESTGWPVGVVYSEDEMLAPLREFALKTALAGTLTLLLMAIAVAIVTRRLTRPLTELALASDRIAQGDLDAPLPAASGNDEVARLVHSFAGMKQDLKAYIEDLEVATARRSRLEGELGAARDIQMGMLPQGGEASERDEAFSLWARVLPARSVGGDLYSYFLRGRQLFFAVGDVSDKGIPAALFMARAISLIQQLAATATDPGEAMAALNDPLTSNNDNCMFLTVFLGILDLDRLELRFASAGHTAPSLVRGAEVMSLEQETGPALGLSPDLSFPVNVIQLQPGDRLAVYTDGFDEAFNEREEMFGVDRFNAALLAGRGLPVAAAGSDLFTRLAAHVGNSPQSDDITLLLLDIGDRDSGASQSAREFTRGPQLTGRVEAWLRQELGQHPVPEQTLGELILVAEEIVSNVDKYAGLAADATITVMAIAERGEVGIEVRDCGLAFNPLDQSGLTELGAATKNAVIGGLGLHLITALTDRQNYRRENGCNILRVTKLLEQPRE
ncbi:MAG: SpoIIE family protein phosphatase [Halieaceae bacterium]|jgi:sigma-B regulation protein RsbU (phosphoserine phosphatase)|nr:SpoIIE family protein phosphatase [Halieaceae bacterium]